jgi:ZIP family zinc transporter
MGGFVELVALSAVMGLSIFLSLPLVLSRSLGTLRIAALNAVAIGILVFLLVDIFSDVAPLLASSTAYQTQLVPDVVFGGSVGGAFLLLFVLERRAPGRIELSSYGTALVIAAAIGFQNLTEGLLFGSLWAEGALAGTLSVIFIGFFLQNVTEGFPITSPLLGTNHPKLGRIVAYFLIGGIPTTIGGVVGYFFNSNLLDILFDGIAMGAILYAILPMLRVAYRPADPPTSSFRKQDMLYLGIVAGFLLGFLVNAF